ncbi:MAG: ABZJ_00895 family protein [Aquisalimonadaceae bacterium]
MTNTPSLKPYYLHFAGAYTAIIVIIAIAYFLLESLLGRELDYNSGIAVGSLLGAGMLSANRFVKDHQRAPSPHERTRLVWVGVLSTLLIAILLILLVTVVVFGEDTSLAVLLLLDQANDMIAFAVLFGILVASAVHAGLLYLAYGYMARKLAEAELKKASRQPHTK